MEIKEYSKYFLGLLFIATVILSIYIVRSFLIPVLTGVIIGYVFFPLHVKFQKKIKNKNISALILSLIIIILITIPIAIISNQVIKETSNMLTLTKDKFSDISCEDNTLCKSLTSIMEDQGTRDQFFTYLANSIKSGATTIIQKATDFLFSVPKRLLDLFITLFTMFYIFVDGQRLVKLLEKMMPLRKRHRKQIVKQFSDVTYALIYGTILVGIIEGIILGFGFFFSGISSPVLWGTVAGFVALIPLLGPTLVWIPAVAIQLWTGHYYAALGVLITGAMVSSIDTFLRPKIIGDKANVHPVLVLIGVLGGLELFGIIGIILGPLVLAFISTFLNIYEKEIQGA